MKNGIPAFPNLFGNAGIFFEKDIRGMARELLLIRHGEAEGNAEGRFLGRMDVPLSARGKAQAKRLRGILPPSAAFVCSPMSRALETAALATGCEAGDLRTDAGLREIDFGDWEGLTFEEIQARDPERVNSWAAFEEEFRFPGGESLAGFQERARLAAERLMNADDETLVAFTHGGMIRALICHFLGLEARHYLLFEVRPASITRLRLWEGRGVLAGLNDVCHLEDC